MAEILLPDGSSKEVERTNDPNRFSVLFPISYYDFAVQNHVQTIGTKTINQWIDTVTNAYQYDQPLEEVKKFFSINTDEHDEDIRMKKYKITTIVTNHDTEKKCLMLRVSLKFQDESMYMQLVDKIK